MKKSIRQLVYEKYDGKCAYTGTPLQEDWQVDHYTPRHFYEMAWIDGADHIDNLMPAQRIVNHYKGALLPETFKSWYLAGLHKRLKKLPKNPRTEKSKKRKAYLMEVAALFGITEERPFDGRFYFEKI